MDSDIIELVLLTIYLKFITTISAKYSSLSIIIIILVAINFISNHYNFKWICGYFGYLFHL